MSISDFEEQLINQLVLEDSSIDQTAGAVFKTVFEAERQNEFLAALNAFGNKKEKEIENVCQQHFQQFAKSIDELLGLRREAAVLKKAVLKVQEELGQCGQLLYDTKVEMYETRRMLDNTQKTVIALNDCLQALNVAQQATLETIDQNYGQALRLIEQLQGRLLPRIEQFSFAIKLEKWIPEQLDTIRTAALDELKAWLGTVRTQCPAIGGLAFSRAQKRIEKWKEIYEGVSTPTAINASAAEDSRSAAAYVDLVEMEREDAASIINNQQVKLDFSPLLKAVHLFDLMNRRSEFQSHFAECRRAQAKVIFDIPVNLKDGEAKSFATFLHNIGGFFIIEYFIVRKPQKFYSPAHVEGLWETAIRMINNYVLESLGSASDQGIFMKVKWLQVFFLHAIEVYDLYSISSMLDTILSLFYRYVDLAKAEHFQAIQASAQSSSLRPLPITNTGFVSRMRQQFKFLSDMKVEKVFPFSGFVVDVFASISEFINNFYIFLEGVPQQSSELDDIAKKTSDWLLEQSAKNYLFRLDSADMDGVVQVVKDFDYLVKICEDIARMLTLKRSRNRVSTTVMNSIEILTKAGHDAEGHLFNLVNTEMDRIFVSNRYEVYPTKVPVSPSRLFTEFNKFYGQTIGRLSSILPPETVKQLKFSMFSHLSSYLTNTLYDKTVSSINMNFVQTLDMDLKAIDEMAGDDHPLNLETFSDVRQLVNLMLADQVHEFLDPIVRNRKYPNLRSSEIVSVLQKVKEPMSKRRNFEDMILLLR